MTPLTAMTKPDTAEKDSRIVLGLDFASSRREPPLHRADPVLRSTRADA